MVVETGVAILVAFGGFIFYMAGLELDQRHTGPKLLFFLMTLWSVVLGLHLAYLMAVADSLDAKIITVLNISVGIAIIISIFITGYFVLMYAIDVMINIGWIKKKGNLKNRMLEEEYYGLGGSDDDSEDG